MWPLKQTLCDDPRQETADHSEVDGCAEQRSRRAIDAIGVSGCLLAVGSALTVDVLVGCAAYAHVTYPHLAAREEPDAVIEPALAAARSVGRRLTGASRNIRVFASSTGLRIEYPEAYLPTGRESPISFVHREIVGKDPVKFYPTGSWYNSIGSIMSSLLCWAKKRRAMWHAVNELERLDSRALRDVGFARFDAQRAVRGNLYFR